MLQDSHLVDSWTILLVICVGASPPRHPPRARGHPELAPELARPRQPDISPARSGKQRPMSRRGTSFGINFEGLVLVSLERAPSKQGVRLYCRFQNSVANSRRAHDCDLFDKYLYKT
jgi:hypothetical protein